MASSSKQSEESIRNDVMQKVLSLVSKESVKNPGKMDVYLDLCKDITKKLVQPKPVRMGARKTVNREEIVDVQPKEYKYNESDLLMPCVQRKTKEFQEDFKTFASLIKQLTPRNLNTIKNKIIKRWENSKYKALGIMGAIFETSYVDPDKVEIRAELISAIVKELDDGNIISHFRMHCMTMGNEMFYILHQTMASAYSVNNVNKDLWKERTMTYIQFGFHLLEKKVLDVSFVEGWLDRAFHVLEHIAEYPFEVEENVNVGIFILKLFGPAMDKNLATKYVRQLIEILPSVKSSLKLKIKALLRLKNNDWRPTN